jgi:hypothetical protein
MSTLDRLADGPVYPVLTALMMVIWLVVMIRRR